LLVVEEVKGEIREGHILGRSGEEKDLVRLRAQGIES